MSPDPFGRAVRDRYLGELAEPLLQRDGPETLEHPIDQFYLDPYPAEPDDPRVAWLESRIDGPLLDLGAGAGRHALHFQEPFETVAIEVSDALVETMRDRGVDDARRGDMFTLPEQFDPDRFRSAIVVGTQVGLAVSMDGLRAFLDDLAVVTTADATAVLDGYDPGAPGVDELLGYRADPTPGRAYRVMQFEYEDEVGEILLFGLFSPDRVREAAADAGWIVTDVDRPSDGNEYYYRSALAKAASGYNDR